MMYNQTLMEVVCYNESQPSLRALAYSVTIALYHPEMKRHVYVPTPLLSQIKESAPQKNVRSAPYANRLVFLFVQLLVWF